MDSFELTAEPTVHDLKERRAVILEIHQQSQRLRNIGTGLKGFAGRRNETRRRHHRSTELFGQTNQVGHAHLDQIIVEGDRQSK